MDLKKQFTLEQALYLLILVAAVLIRFWNLGDLPLTETEAQSALSAHQLAVDMELTSDSFDAGYALLTSVIFMIFGSSVFLARLIPALLGSAVLLFPYLLRKPLGRTAAIILSVGLAFDPLLVFLSRQAGGGMLAVFSALSLITALYIRKPILAGISAGLLLVGAPFSLVGLSILFVIWVLIKVLKISPSPNLKFFSGSDLRDFLAAGFISLLALGTLLLLRPDGIGWIGENIWQYLQGWISGGAPMWKMGLAVPAYLLLPLVFGLAGAVYAVLRRSRTGIVLSLLALAAAAVILVYPGRQAADLVWLSLLLWLLAAREIARIIKEPVQDLRVLILQISLVLFTGVFLYLNMAASSHISPMYDPVSGAADGIGMGKNFILLGIFGFMVLASLLTGLAWNTKDSNKGLTIGLFVLLLAFSINTAWQGNNQLDRFVNELWHSGPAVVNANLVKSTVEDIGLISQGISSEVETLYQVDSAALGWLLRDLPNARYTSQFSAAAFPDILFTDIQMDEPFLSAAYRGHSFAWRSHSINSDGLQQNFYDWLLFRNAPPITEEVILWARADLFPDGSIIDNDLPAVDFEPLPEENDISPAIE